MQRLALGVLFQDDLTGVVAAFGDDLHRLLEGLQGDVMKKRRVSEIVHPSHKAHPSLTNDRNTVCAAGRRPRRTPVHRRVL
ncbi:hypothetical protein GCM10008961_33730 [Deinococcus knuensis]|uniref:Uncharacterized protein n=1 Tax=Deinococcus knuensis TaxID=1837380 RepID=A0ABQ2SUS6_9DEIO|nr:hypothetical protein GCM10008961_33730 [Deinococcus knuensis]